uniref:Uncharacterized protein n=1 Tax=Rhizophora mucronata TaxID=61149 RepID=A0A2P2QPE3_RHIMU
MGKIIKHISIWRTEATYDSQMWEMPMC